MKLIVLNELKLSALDMPYGARLCIREIDRAEAMNLTRRHKVEMPRPPAYKSDRISEALEMPPPQIFKVKEGDQVLVCECPGFRAVLFYLVEFVGDLEPDEDDDPPEPTRPNVYDEPLNPFED